MQPESILEQPESIELLQPHKESCSGCGIKLQSKKFDVAGYINPKYLVPTPSSEIV
jgi:hypothetical protein